MSVAMVQTFVSNVAEVGYADAVEAMETRVGHEVVVGGVRLHLQVQTVDSVSGMTWMSGVLHTGSALSRPVKVDVVLSPWSAHRTEVGIRPISRTGAPDSLRTRRFLDAAWAVLPELTARVSEGRAVDAPLLATAAA